MITPALLIPPGLVEVAPGIVTFVNLKVSFGAFAAVAVNTNASAIVKGINSVFLHTYLCPPFFLKFGWLRWNRNLELTMSFLLRFFGFSPLRPRFLFPDPLLSIRIRFRPFLFPGPPASFDYGG